MSKISISAKLTAIFAALLLVALVQGGASLVGISKLGQTFDELYLDSLASTNFANKMNTVLGDRRIAESEHILSSDDQHWEIAEKGIEEATAAYEKFREKYEGTIRSDQTHEKQLAESLRNGVLKYSELEKKLLAESRINHDAEAQALYRGEMKDVYDRVGAILDEIISIQDKDAAASYESSNSLRRSVLIASVVALLFMAATALGSMMYVRRQVSGSIKSMTSAMSKLSSGDLSVEIPGAERADEIGEMAKTLQVFKNELTAKKASDQSAAREAEMKIKRGRRVDDITHEFEQIIGEIVNTVSSASSQLESSAGTLSGTAERSRELATAVSAASEEASANVQSVASATEELSSSVNEISRQVQESARIATDAVDQSRTTTARVSELSKAATRIGDVVELINTIAGQTNLLALNATIEAARAGEAGRGFAVVASEVKALAEQTARATGEIGQQISGIQAATQESVNAIREISVTIERLSEISSAIAAAVEEQGAATLEISRNVQQAAQGTEQVSSNIAGVQRGAGETGSASSQVLSAAQLLSRDSNRLKLEVNKFLNSVRAA